jgi:hypothetical protein
VELERIRRRFTELSVTAAAEGARQVRPMLDSLSARLGLPPVPDLGPAVVPDQLTVLVHDAYAAGQGTDITAALALLRRTLP